MNPRSTMTANALRSDISARNLQQPRSPLFETTYGGSVVSVIYGADADGAAHGNFHPASYRRILADAAWRRRLEKTYTAQGRMARRHDRRRGELECATSSDALLMNVFCYPGMTARRALCALLGVAAGLRPEFGVRVEAPLHRGLRDRTEVDMMLGDCLVEAKLTEGGFQTARPALLERYRDLEDVFAVEELPRRGELSANYQLVRSVLAAHARQERFVLLCDGRRGDLVESWFRVLCAVRLWELRGRLRLLTWQEVAGAVPRGLQVFLAEKYGIEAG